VHEQAGMTPSGSVKYVCHVWQVNKLEITTDKRLLAAAGNPQIRLFEVASGNNQAVLTYEGHTSNVTAVRTYAIYLLFWFTDILREGKYS
jgi:hypothetical protein